MLALAADVQRITSTMQELEKLEGLLERETHENEGKVTGRSIEIRGSIKKLMTNPDVVQCLNRLEVKVRSAVGLDRGGTAVANQHWLYVMMRLFSLNFLFYLNEL